MAQRLGGVLLPLWPLMLPLPLPSLPLPLPLPLLHPHLLALGQPPSPH